MRFKILYSKIVTSNTVVAILDLKCSTIIEVSLDELNKNSIDKELKEFLIPLLPKIENGYWDYKFM